MIKTTLHRVTKGTNHVLSGRTDDTLCYRWRTIRIRFSGNIDAKCIIVLTKILFFSFNVFLFFIFYRVFIIGRIEIWRVDLVQNQLLEFLYNIYV